MLIKQEIVAKSNGRRTHFIKNNSGSVGATVLVAKFLSCIVVVVASTVLVKSNVSHRAELHTNCNQLLIGYTIHGLFILSYVYANEDLTKHPSAPLHYRLAVTLSAFLSVLSRILASHEFDCTNKN